MGYILTLADITSIKLNEEYQRQLSTQAVERRRQQENFIDVFSHELRNPFSATLQCADGILSALMEFQNNGEKEHGLDVEEMIDSASTILVCVQHQVCKATMMT
jgi:signal transduction histidine kinase